MNEQFILFLILLVIGGIFSVLGHHLIGISIHFMALAFVVYCILYGE